jgi:hypothetical protein
LQQGWSLPKWSPIQESEVRILALSANIRIVLKCLTVTNSLAYSDTKLIMPLKNFMVWATERKWQTKKALKNQAKSVARLCHLVAARCPDMFCNFHFVKKYICYP